MPKYTFKEIVSKCEVKRNIKEGEKVECAHIGRPRQLNQRRVGERFAAVVNYYHVVGLGNRVVEVDSVAHLQRDLRREQDFLARCHISASTASPDIWRHGERDLRAHRFPRSSHPEHS